MTRPQIVAIVDDDAAIREALEGLLKSCGYACKAFSSSEEFLAGAAARSVVCIILDVTMPGISGIDLQVELTSRGPAPPVIFLTSQFDERIRASALQGGALAFLEKPVDAEVLLETLRKATTG